MRIGTYVKRLEVERDEKWREIIDTIPRIKFFKGWEVQPIPPFGGVTVRFRVFKGEKSVSVYLDTMDRLGFFEGPYWEVYPYRDDVGRCAIDDVDKLLQMIKSSLNTRS